ncbi:MAG: hypothetical protein U0941_00195 [Planctomycetaceae bacterium]
MAKASGAGDSKKPAKVKKKAVKKAASPAEAKGRTRAKSRTGISDIHISPDERVRLYAAARYLPSSFEKKSGLMLPFTTYVQDPFVAREKPEFAFDEAFVDWEPGLADGPTSARFAIVDYDTDKDVLTPPAEWDEAQQKFVFRGKVLDSKTAELYQFHQVSVWTLLQGTLAFFESGEGLGRRISWAFEGNRLIVVPHAGEGENAYYDRASKSLQFYYFEGDRGTVYTCLSSDIVHHEFGHAVLDGVRPYFNESSSVQTAAFHEFIGDLTAILLTLRNNELRRRLAVASNGKIEDATELSSIAEEFGMAVSGRPYLRTARNDKRMSDMQNETSPHNFSQVLTGAMFDILMRLAAGYQAVPDGESKKVTPKQAFWRAAERMQRMAIQPLDLLPPVDVTFRDYALAVCRAQQLADPIDPNDYYGMLIDVFHQREILSEQDVQELTKDRYLFERLRLSVFHDMGSISRSRAAAYRFLDDNREDLLIPASQDFIVADLYDANKSARQGMRLGRQIILEYVWREDVTLDGPQFGKFNGKTTHLLCGGTLVFDDIGNVLAWARKPGSLPYGGKRNRTGEIQKRWESAVQEGTARRDTLLANLADQIASGRVGDIVATGQGFMGASVPPMTAEEDGDEVRFHLTPHLHLCEDGHEHEDEGARQWEISC